MAVPRKTRAVSFAVDVQPGSQSTSEGPTTRLVRAWQLVLVLLALFAIAIVRGVLPAAPHPNLAGAGLSADQIKSSAASQLAAASAKGGSGFSFEIVQTSTIVARAGGPLIDVPDPSNGFKTIGQTDHAFFYSLIERGVVRSDGFWSQMRTGPAPGEQPDFDKSEVRREALVVNGASWRNDQHGWYKADVLPGVGLDPATVALLPSLLRDSSSALSRDSLTVDGAQLVRVDATGTVADIPGLVAADGASYTKLTAPIEFGFDDHGRLAWIHAQALNLNMKDFDLVVDTVITLTYDSPGPLPQPAPTWVPPSPDPEGGA